MALLSISVGILLLWFGGTYFVRGSVAIAHRLHVSELMIGLTLVGFGTSLPELVTSMGAALSDSPGLAVGNVVGSNIANILLILGLVAFVRPFACNMASFYRDALALSAATLIGVIVILNGSIGIAHGIAMLVALTAYIAFAYVTEQKTPHTDGNAASIETSPAFSSSPAAPSSSTAPRILLIGTWVVVGLAAVIAGAWLLIEGAIELATFWGVSKTFIGLTVVAVGTSVPELMITLIAALRGQSDIALGNVIGSNIFNLLGILGLTSVVTTISVPADLKAFDLAAMALAAAALIAVAGLRKHFGRVSGAVFVALYLAYTLGRTQVAA